MKQARTTQRLTILVALIAMTGCAQVTDWLQGRPASASSNSVILGAPEADTYLQELYNLAVGNPPAQAEIYADAESAALLTPGANTGLWLALVVATPGHSEYNPERAQSLLREILAQTELLTPAEVALATIHLSNVERVIVASAEARRLRESSSRDARSEADAVNQRLKNLEDENRRLRRELEAAESKLEAITTIERSIREQE